jgi:hypothetical protein
MPLGSGYSAEEQITGQGTVGGLQIVAYPLKPEAYRHYMQVPQHEGRQVFRN